MKLEQWRVEALLKKAALFKPLIFCVGLGTNTLGLLAMLKRLGIVPDALLFADTKAERDATYRLIPVINEWCDVNGFPRLTVVRIAKGLYEDCWDRMTFPSVTFGLKSCSQRWKIRPQDNWIKVWPTACEAWENGKKVYKLLGIGADEPQRLNQPTDSKDRQRFVNVFFLDDLNMDRDECIEAIDEEGFPRPGKSACIFCSNTNPDEVLQLAKDEPHNASRALALEDRALGNLKRLKRIKGLGRKWNWRDLIEGRISREEAWKLHGASKMPCGCSDGEEEIKP